jgi:hypothetical protein
LGPRPFCSGANEWGTQFLSIPFRMAEFVSHLTNKRMTASKFIQSCGGVRVNSRLVLPPVRAVELLIEWRT